MEEKQLKEAIAALCKDKAKREALAQLIVEYINPQHITTDFISLLLDTRNMKPGDALVKKVRKGIRVHTLAPGSIHLGNEITVVDRMNYILDGADVKVMYNLWELEKGEIGTVESIRAEMLARLKDYYFTKVFTALTTIWTAVNTPLNFTNTGGALTEAALIAAMNQITQTVGKVKAVVGVRSALQPITTFGAFWQDPGAAFHAVPTTIVEIMQTGWIGTFSGAPIIAVDQVWDYPDTYLPLLPRDKVLVIGDKVGEFVTFGEVNYKQYDDMKPTPPYWYLELWQQFGMIIDKAQGIHVLGNIV